MSRLYAFAALTRPVFLLGGALLYGLGAALSPEPIDWAAYAAGQALVTAVQMSAQYANEYYDQEADRLGAAGRTWLTGGSGVLTSGRLAPATALRAAAITATAALGAALVVAAANVPAALVGVAALAGSWLYSAPPARLVGTMAGVSVASVIVTGLTPLTGALLQGSVATDRLIAVAVPLLLLHHAMLIAFEHPDIPGDAAAGKQTLSVRLSATATERLHRGLLAATYGALLGAAWLGSLEWSEAGWALALAPLGLVQAWSYSRASGSVLATVAVGLLSGTAAALLLGVA
jgi:1,4-dihydroxy-2-naphthoate octaprenyltransferase